MHSLSNYEVQIWFTGDDEVQLRREITVIEELLGEQPDSKCMKNLVL